MHPKLFLVFFFCISSYQYLKAQVSGSWKEILEKKRGNVEVVWSGLDPFIYKEKIGNKDTIRGIEADVLRSFFYFVEKKYSVKIKIKWREVPFFADVLPTVAQSKGCYFGASAMSITDERKRNVAFMPPYMPDIAILISNSQVPIYTNPEDFTQNAPKFVAFTSHNSTYENYLKDLQSKYQVKFPIEYASESEDLVDLVAQNPTAIAYLDLPIYLKYLEKGYRIKRQFLFKNVREGYATLLPKNHDWNEPIQEFAQSYSFKTAKQEAVKKYLGVKNMEILWDLSGGQETSILGREKIIEDKKRVEEALELEKQKTLFAQTIIFTIVVAFVLVVIGGVFLYRYRSRNKANQILTIKNEEIRQQKAEIEAQIEQKNKEISEAWQIQKQKEQLEELNFTKDKFFSIIAHDLRIPINSLLGFTNLLSNYADAMTTEEVKKISEDLNKSLQNVLQLIEDLLTWARSQMNKVDFKPEQISVNDIIREDIELSNILFQKKEITLETEISPNLQAFADADHVKFVLRNLVTNALKFTNRNGKVSIKAFEQDKMIWIQVVDNGVGIPQEIQDKMFQLDAIKSTKGTDNEKGTGLGLVLCKEFVRKNGGDIWVKSQEGEGSCFTFSLRKYEE
jgi:signal transduction histidine kinase